MAWGTGTPDTPGGGGRGQIQRRPRERKDRARRRECRALELLVLGPGALPRLALSGPGGQPLRSGVDTNGTGPGLGLLKLPATTGRAVIIFWHDSCPFQHGGTPNRDSRFPPRGGDPGPGPRAGGSSGPAAGSV